MAWTLPQKFEEIMKGDSLRPAFTILIADRNPRVRDFLKREMTSEGYRVRLARNGREVLQCVNSSEPPDLLIVDLDLPDAGQTAILEQVQERMPTVPVVVHTFLSEYLNHPPILSNVALVEKEGSNIDRLKNVVLDVLRKSYPRRALPAT
jgi:DNA-binding NtrC family response regulator